jgi:hypothetical protein
MRRRNILIGTLAVAVVVATIGGVAYALHARAQEQADEALYPGLHGPVSVVCPGPTDSIASRGLPAIHPRNDCTPSFTEQDVRDYVAHGQLFPGGRIELQGQPTVKRLVFLTIADLNRIGQQRLLGGFPPDRLVCYVELRGTFIFATLGGSSSDSAATIAFDAHTGKELGFGLDALLG